MSDEKVIGKRDAIPKSTYNAERFVKKNVIGYVDGGSPPSIIKVEKDS